jgi:hypothetical protein
VRIAVLSVLGSVLDQAFALQPTFKG